MLEVLSHGIDMNEALGWPNSFEKEVQYFPFSAISDIVKAKLF